MRWYRESFNAQTCLFGEVKLLQPQMTKVRLSIIFLSVDTLVFVLENK